MKTVVTGSEGFIGSALCSRMYKERISYLPLDRSKGDLTVAALDEILEPNSKVDLIVNLASRTYVPLSWKTPEKFIESSLLVTLNVLKYCRDNRTPLIQMSAYVYGQQDSLPIAENAKIIASNPYALSKYLTEEMCKYYASIYDLDITVLRPFNVYGPGQKSHFLIPLLVEQLISSDEIVVDSFLPKRDYIYVDDVVEAVLLASQHIGKYQVYNIGSGQSHSVYQIISLLEKVSGKNIQCRQRFAPRKNEIDDVVADISSAAKELDWRPNVTLEQGISEILREASR